MIEMVYSGKDSEEQGEVRIPKNIRQIGNNQSHKKVYIEDYVMTYLKKKPEKEGNIKYGVLLGETKKGRGNTYIFVKGMVMVREVIENSLIFNDDIWSGIYKDMKQYFDNMNIVGWFVSVPYRVSDDMNGIRKTHLDNFAGNDKVCFLSDRTEKEDGFYIYEQGNLEKQQGYYIYYEKNEKMKKYVKSSKNNSLGNEQKLQSGKNDNSTHNEKESSEQNTKKNVSKNQSENVSAVPAKNKKETEQKSFREFLLENPEGEHKKQGKFAYGISGLLIVALLLSTVVMLNNYGELKNIKQTLSNLNGNNEAKAVNELLGSYGETSSNSDESGSTKEQNTSKTNTALTESASKGTTPSTTASTSLNSKTNNGGKTTGENTERATESKTEKSVRSSLAGTYLKVKPGQTLYDISMKYYGTSDMVEEIRKINNIDKDYTIVEGQKILLP